MKATKKSTKKEYIKPVFKRNKTKISFAFEVIK